jgi:thioredoxin-dependent peroxiredoxin
MGQGMFPFMLAAFFSATPKVGDLAPDFTTKDSLGKTVNLTTLLARGPVVLAFFPKAFTSG